MLQFYARRLRRHWRQELLAAAGIAIGVALVFAVLVSNSSITASAREVIHDITGNATLQLAARGPSGFDQRMLASVRRLPGVEHAAPMLEQRGSVVYRSHRAAVDIVGVDASLPDLGGVVASYYQLGGLVLQRGVVLPSAVGDALNLPATTTGSTPPHVNVEVRGRATPTRVTAVLGAGRIGRLSDSILAVVSLPYAQELAGLHDQITRILVVAKPGHEAAVRSELAAIGGNDLTVASVDQEARLLEQATGPIDQATGLFAAISAFVGLLFAFNAMLLTVPERRRFTATLRRLGYRRTRVLQILGFQALVLGIAASAVGLLGGYFLSRAAAGHPPSYLTFAFPLGTHAVIPFTTIVEAFVGGVIATCLASVQPMLDLRRGRSITAVFSERGEPGHALSPSARRRLGLAAALLVVATTLVALLVSSLTVLAVGALALATVLAIPAAFAGALRLGDAAVRGFQRINPDRGRGNMLLLAVRELRATTIRSLALAATGAVAVFGSVAIEGAHSNLVNGLDRNFGEYLSTAQLWVTPGGAENSLTTESFSQPGVLRTLQRVPTVAEVRPYFGGLLDLPDRRAWIIGRPVDDAPMLAPSQITQGNLATATKRLRSGGWVAVSEAVARTQRARLGDSITLPTPSGRRSYRVAARLTNLGWGPGAVVMSAPDYRKAWSTNNPSALEINLRPGSNVNAARRAVRQQLASYPALRVQTSAERDVQFESLARQGLSRLRQISTLLLIAAVLAMAAAMSAGVLQRRETFARRRIQGYRSAQLRHILLLEAGLILGTGSLAGALFGIYGHALGNRWLQISTGYPAPFSFDASQTITTCVAVLAVALALSAWSGYSVSRPPRRVSRTPPPPASIGSGA
jgi:putative ABC transport system permease protein